MNEFCDAVALEAAKMLMRLVGHNVVTYAACSAFLLGYAYGRHAG